MTPLHRRRFLLGYATCVSLTVAACQGAPDMSPLRGEVVAEVGDAKLTGAEMERWLLASPDSLNPITPRVLVSLWIDQALFAEALRTNAILDDSATTHDALWAIGATRAIQAYWVNRRAGLPPLKEMQLDSLFDLDNARVFQKLLIATDMSDTLAIREAGNKGRALKKRVDAGEDFTTLVRTVSDDTTSRTTDGYLVAVTRDELAGDPVLTAYAREIWLLAPGAITRPIGVPDGVVLIRRATREQSRTGLRSYLTPILGIRGTNQYIDSIAAARRLTVLKGAPERARKMAREPHELGTPEEPLATWEGGQLDALTVRRWLTSMPAVDQVRFTGASESDITNYLFEISRRQMAIPMLDTPITASADWQSLITAYRNDLEAQRTEVTARFGAAPPRDAGVGLMDSLIMGSRLRAHLPGDLGAVLRQRFAVKYHDDVVEKVYVASNFAWLAKHVDVQPKQKAPEKP